MPLRCRRAAAGKEEAAAGSDDDFKVPPPASQASPGLPASQQAGAAGPGSQATLEKVPLDLQKKIYAYMSAKLQVGRRCRVDALPGPCELLGLAGGALA